MNKWVKRKWLRALKSGEYKKGKGALCRSDQNTYCCLGVLVEEMAPEFLSGEDKDSYSGKEYRGVVEGRSVYTDFLPDDLAIMWGLGMKAQEDLAGKNDNSDGFGPVIAYIEENL